MISGSLLSLLCEKSGIVSTGIIRDHIDTIRDNANCHSTLYVVEMPFGTIEVIQVGEKIL